EESRSPSQKGNRRARQARLVGHIRKTSMTVIPIERFVVVGKRRGEKINSPLPLVIADRDPHGRLLASVFAQRKSRRVTYILKCAVVPVAIEIVGCGIIRHHQIHPSVVIYVDESGGQTVITAGIRNACLHTYIRECAISVVMK